MTSINLEINLDIKKMTEKIQNILERIQDHIDLIMESEDKITLVSSVSQKLFYDQEIDFNLLILEKYLPDLKENLLCLYHGLGIEKTEIGLPLGLYLKYQSLEEILTMIYLYDHNKKKCIVPMTVDDQIEWYLDLIYKITVDIVNM